MNIRNYINGKFVDPAKNSWLDNYCPGNGEIYGHIPNSNQEDVEIAVKAAKTAFR